MFSSVRLSNNYRILRNGSRQVKLGGTHSSFYFVGSINDKWFHNLDRSKKGLEVTFIPTIDGAYNGTEVTDYSSVDDRFISLINRKFGDTA